MTAISNLPYNRIHIAGPISPIIDIYPAIEAITPGMLLEYHLDSGVLKLGVHDAATDPLHGVLVALERSEFGSGIETAYSIGEQVRAAVFYPGSIFQALIPIGEDIDQVELLMSNGNGMLKAFVPTIPDPADTPGTADVLRDDLVANVLPVIRNYITAKFMSLADSGGAVGAISRLKVLVTG